MAFLLLIRHLLYYFLISVLGRGYWQTSTVRSPLCLRPMLFWSPWVMTSDGILPKRSMLSSLIISNSLTTSTLTPTWGWKWGMDGSICAANQVWSQHVFIVVVVVVVVVVRFSLALCMTITRLFVSLWWSPEASLATEAEKKPWERFLL